jgi:hypothetical protein
MATVNEQLRDEVVHHQVDLLRYSNHVVRRIIALLNRVDADLFAQLVAAIDNAGSNASVQRLELLLLGVRQINADAYAQLAGELQSELRGLADAELAYQQQLFEVVPVRLSIAMPTLEQVYAAALARPFQGRLLSEWAQGIEAGRMVRIRDAVRMGIVENQTTQQIVQRIRGTRAKGYGDGLIEIDRRHAEAVVRTAVQHVAGVVRDSVLEANADLLRAVQWVSTLDSRTSMMCFPGSTAVVPVGDMLAVSKRTYQGEVVVVTTASGKQLRATPNHPVLTARGWRAIQELNPGADVLYRVVGDAIGGSCSENVGVPAAISALADALARPSVGKVFVERTSQADFHGDGELGQHEVHIPRSDCNLGQGLNAAGFHEVVETLLSGVAVGASLARLCDGDFLRVGQSCVHMASEFDASSVQDRVQAALAHSESPDDFVGSHSTPEGIDDICRVTPAFGFTAAQGRHDAGPLEQASYGGCGCPVGTAERRGADSVRVLPDDVIAVRRELFSDGHVYNLSTSTEWYLADGFLVHNCRIRDGLKYTADTHKPIGHKVPWLSGPGRAHWQCRSCSAPVLKSWRELGIDMDGQPESVRASMDGEVPAETTFAEWIKKQSARRQDDILGPKRGKLLRAGGLDLADFYNEKGRALTLDELRQRNAEAFRRAGI